MNGSAGQGFPAVFIFVLFLKCRENTFHGSHSGSHDSTSVVESWRKDTSIGTYFNEKCVDTCALCSFVTPGASAGGGRCKHPQAGSSRVDMSFLKVVRTIAV